MRSIELSEPGVRFVLGRGRNEMGDGDAGALDDEHQLGGSRGILSREPLLVVVPFDVGGDGE